MENTYVVYAHVNKINGKVYVGQTKKQPPELRWGKQGKGYVSSSHFYHAIQQYGWDNFQHIILKERLTSEEADKWEQYYIQYYKSDNPQYGYNLRSGGKDNYTVNAEGVDHNRKAHKARGEEKCQSKRVRCKETGDVFPCIADAARWCGSKKIFLQLRGERQHAGRHPETGELLTWELVDENTPITQRCPKEIEPSVPRHSPKIRLIMCINTGEIFNNAKEASLWAFGHENGRADILRCCHGTRKSAGKHPITQERLLWKFIDDEKENA